MAVALTTTDNPYDPFTQFSLWNVFDRSKGYNSSTLLARVAMTSPFLSDEENERELEQAIDRICEMNFTGNYIKVSNKPREGGQK